MNKRIFSILLAFCIFLPSFSVWPSAPAILVEIEGIKHSKGKIVVAVFSDENEFLTTDYWSNFYPIAGEHSIEVTIENIPPGEYAISIFHDENDNGKLDTNFIGIPKEPYGFSNNPVIKLRPPTFMEAKFVHRQLTHLAIKVK